MGIIVHLDCAGKIAIKQKAVITLINNINSGEYCLPFRRGDEKRVIQLYILRNFYNLDFELTQEAHSYLQYELFRIKVGRIWDRLSKLILNRKIYKFSENRLRQLNKLWQWTTKVDNEYYQSLKY